MCSTGQLWSTCSLSSPFSSSHHSSIPNTVMGWLGEHTRLSGLGFTCHLSLTVSRSPSAVMSSPAKRLISSPGRLLTRGVRATRLSAMPPLSAALPASNHNAGAFGSAGDDVIGVEPLQPSLLAANASRGGGSPLCIVNGSGGGGAAAAAGRWDGAVAGAKALHSQHSRRKKSSRQKQRVCACVYLCVCICLWVSVCVCLCVSVCLSVCLSACLSVSLSVCPPVCLCDGHTCTRGKVDVSPNPTALIDLCLRVRDDDCRLLRAIAISLLSSSPYQVRLSERKGDVCVCVSVCLCALTLFPHASLPPPPLSMLLQTTATCANGRNRRRSARTAPAAATAATEPQAPVPTAAIAAALRLARRVGGPSA